VQKKKRVVTAVEHRSNVFFLPVAMIRPGFTQTRIWAGIMPLFDYRGLRGMNASRPIRGSTSANEETPSMPLHIILSAV
jgi:hypothetical protein